jgi:hypothetical protein
MIHSQSPVEMLRDCLAFLHQRQFDLAERRIDDLIRDAVSAATPRTRPKYGKAPDYVFDSVAAALLGGLRPRLASALRNTNNQRKDAAIADLQTALSQLVGPTLKPAPGNPNRTG